MVTSIVVKHAVSILYHKMEVAAASETLVPSYETTTYKACCSWCKIMLNSERLQPNMNY